MLGVCSRDLCSLSCLLPPASSSLSEPLCTRVAAMPHIFTILHGCWRSNPDPRVGGSLHCWGHTPGRALLLPGDSPRCGVQLPCCRAPWGAGTLLTRDNPGQEEPEQLFVLSCPQIYSFLISLSTVDAGVVTSNYVLRLISASPALSAPAWALGRGELRRCLSES